MKLTRITVLAFSALLFAVPAQAQDFMFKPYVGGGIGAYELDYGNGTDFVVGGYGALGADLHEFLAVEVRGGSAGNKTKNDITTNLPNGNVKAQVSWFVSYLAKPRVEVADGFRIYGLIGASTVNSSITPAGAVEREKTDTDLSFGGGAEYQITDNFTVGAEWLRLTTSKDTAVITATSGYNGMDINSIVGTLRVDF